MSRPWPWVTLVMPVTWPAFVMRRSPWLRAHPIQMLSSFLRRTVRWKLMPQVSLFGSKFSVRNGISISIVQPISLRSDARVPDAVPLPVVAVDAEERIGHQPRRVHLEEVAGPRVEEGVDRPHEAVVGAEELVAAALEPEPLVGLGVETGHAHVDGVLREDDAHFGGLGGRRAVGGIDLDEVGGRRGACQTASSRRPSTSIFSPSLRRVAPILRRAGVSASWVWASAVRGKVATRRKAYRDLGNRGTETAINRDHPCYVHGELPSRQNRLDYDAWRAFVDPPHLPIFR